MIILFFNHVLVLASLIQMYELRTESTIFVDDDSLTMTQIVPFRQARYSSVLNAFAPVFVLLAVVLIGAIVILFLDFLKAYRKNKDLTVNFRQQQQFV